MHDITRTISNATTPYPGDGDLRMRPLYSIAGGCPCNVTALDGWTSHTLTHLDPPYHFFEDGASLDELPLERFLGRALVVSIAGDVVTTAHVRGIGDYAGKSVLFQTRNSAIATEAPFAEDHVYLSPEAAEALVAGGANLVGIDYLSVDRFGDEDYPVHRILLGQDVLILEGLDLSGVPAGEYDLIALPLKIKKGDGSPVRAVLR